MDNQTNENEIFNEDKKERALLISVDTGDFNAEVSMEELEELAKTAGAESCRHINSKKADSRCRNIYRQGCAL